MDTFSHGPGWYVVGIDIHTEATKEMVREPEALGVGPAFLCTAPGVLFQLSLCLALQWNRTSQIFNADICDI